MTGMTQQLTVHPVPGHGAEDVVVDDEGRVYTGTDDGTVHRLSPDGRVIERLGATGGRPLGLELLPDGRVEVVLDGLHFANGVALAADESYVTVAETAARTVVRRWLTGPRAGQRDLLAKDLPGYPDNIARGSDGLIWVTIASPTVGSLERIMRGPLPLRRLVWRLPAAVQPKAKRCVRVMALDDAGTVVHDLSRPGTHYHMVTGVREHAGRVWLGSLEEGAVAVLDLPGHR